MTDRICRTVRCTSALRICTALLVATGLSFAPVGAQEPPWVPAYPLKLSVARALALATASDRQLPYVPGEVLVRFKPGMSAARQQRALQAVRSQPRVADLRWIRDIAVLHDAREADATILAAQLREQPEILSAEPNRLYRTTAAPNDPGYERSQWNLKAIDMPRAWDLNPGATASVTVAVLDTGVNTVDATYSFRTWDGRDVRTVSVPFRTNPDLAVSRLVRPLDFVFWGGPVLDLEGHGTHVASTVGEDTNNGVAQAGIAYNASIMPLKVCVGYWEVQFILSANGYNGFAPRNSGGCPDDATIEGVYYAADNGAKVINLSLGGSEPSPGLNAAIEYAVGKGVFVAIAAGNEFEDGNPASYPAAAAAAIDGVMSVAAVGPSLTHAYYSNTGSWVEIAAPGGDTRTDGSDGLIWQAGLSISDADPRLTTAPRFDRYFEIGLQGTSMATPHVSGIAALLFSQGVTRPGAIEALIKKTARDLGAKGRDDESGVGLIQPRAALLGLGVAK